MKFRSRFVSRLLARGLVAVLRLLYATCRITSIEAVPGNSPYEPAQRERFLYCIWHDVLLMAIFCGRPCRMAALVSQHQDGGYLADSMELINIQPIRGSSRRGGAQALKQCLDAAADFHVAVTPDGPRGPRHELKDGILFMASVSGRKIVPVTASCQRGWRIQGNWTDMLLPLPFSRVIIKAGEPLTIPGGLSREELVDYRTQLQRRMEDLTLEVEQMLHPERAIINIQEAARPFQKKAA